MRYDLENPMVIGDYYTDDEPDQKEIQRKMAVRECSHEDAFDFCVDFVEDHEAKIISNFMHPGSKEIQAVARSKMLFNLILNDNPDAVFEMAYDMVANDQDDEYLTDFADWLIERSMKNV